MLLGFIIVKIQPYAPDEQKQAGITCGLWLTHLVLSRKFKSVCIKACVSAGVQREFLLNFFTPKCINNRQSHKHWLDQTCSVHKLRDLLLCHQLLVKNSSFSTIASVTTLYSLYDGTWPARENTELYSSLYDSPWTLTLKMSQNCKKQTHILGKEDLISVRDLCPITCGQQKVSQRNHITLILVLRLKPVLFPVSTTVAVIMH